MIEQEVQEMATLYQEENGIRWYRQRLHYNMFYLVANGRVFERCGFHARNLYNHLVSLDDEARTAWIAEAERKAKALPWNGEEQEAPLRPEYAALEQEQPVVLPEQVVQQSMFGEEVLV